VPRQPKFGTLLVSRSAPWIPLAPFPYPEFPVPDATSSHRRRPGHSPPAAPRPPPQRRRPALSSPVAPRAPPHQRRLGPFPSGGTQSTLLRRRLAPPPKNGGDAHGPSRAPAPGSLARRREGSRAPPLDSSRRTGNCPSCLIPPPAGRPPLLELPEVHVAGFSVPPPVRFLDGATTGRCTGRVHAVV
jgi:hypothetical protein